MILEIKKDNIDSLKESFIDINYISNEFNNNPFIKFFVLKEDNEIIGFIYYSDIYDRAEINQFEINEIHRSCGKGEFLLRETMKIIDKDITLEVKKDNFPAISLYEKVGFVKEAIREGYYQGTNGILMLYKKEKI